VRKKSKSDKKDVQELILQYCLGFDVFLYMYAILCTDLVPFCCFVTKMFSFLIRGAPAPELPQQYQT